ncbi:hypothetical protein TCAL_10976 [Tigriopus californicus]|uniref:Dynein heavy chain AAA lid domain-containing protein n=1 Tax=Tigriopus californicus TaxID=6832 RepID=A0A553NEZ4_TIGCA|nr:hypothetical protein TCAL_10976 [Tigriopus californicus]|eukprot:TCALIF_10976-PA protein Name:"Similar to PF11_0240 Dynein heavy chain-like protein PF11_0240 (Plasmodium falciparum (isolate 3D7))" AED:0.10 eAED:0.10 QI:54/0.5/0.66/0.66/0.5/0.66/3/0/172
MASSSEMSKDEWRIIFGLSTFQELLTRRSEFGSRAGFSQIIRFNDKDIAIAFDIYQKMKHVNETFSVQEYTQLVGKYIYANQLVHFEEKNLLMNHLEECINENTMKISRFPMSLCKDTDLVMPNCSTPNAFANFIKAHAQGDSIILLVLQDMINDEPSICMRTLVTKFKVSP